MVISSEWAAEIEEDREKRDEVFAELLKHYDPRYSYIDLSISRGWNDLVLALHDELVALDPHYVINQIKEKFGGLRYYATPSGEYYQKYPQPEKPDDMSWLEFHQWLQTQPKAPHPFRDAINEAQGKSFDICERCGQPGQISGNGWVKTLCKLHQSTEGKEALPPDDEEMFK